MWTISISRIGLWRRRSRLSPCCRQWTSDLHGLHGHGFGPRRRRHSHSRHRHHRHHRRRRRRRQIFHRLGPNPTPTGQDPTCSPHSHTFARFGIHDTSWMIVKLLNFCCRSWENKNLYIYIYSIWLISSIYCLQIPFGTKSWKIWCSASSVCLVALCSSNSCRTLFRSSPSEAHLDKRWTFQAESPIVTNSQPQTLVTLVNSCHVCVNSQDVCVFAILYMFYIVLHCGVNKEAPDLCTTASSPLQASDSAQQAQPFPFLRFKT